jgi:hypothetical protein
MGHVNRNEDLYRGAGGRDGDVARSVVFAMAIAGLASCNQVLGLDPPTLDRCAIDAALCTLDGSGTIAADAFSDAPAETGPVDDSAGTDREVSDGAPEASTVPVDGTADDTASEASETPSDAMDAMVDGGPKDVVTERTGDGPSGFGTVRCGGGTSPAYCVLSSSVCCQTVDGAGAAAFNCVPKGTCNGYPIECANANDCRLNLICCHYDFGMTCEPPTGPRSSCPLMSMTTVNQACDPANAVECPAGSSCTMTLINGGQPSPYLGCP